MNVINRLREVISFLTGFSIVSIAMIIGTKYLLLGKNLYAFLAAATCWLAYITSHFMANGVLADGRSGESLNETDKIKLGIGIILFITGFISVTRTLGTGLNPLSYMSFMTMFSGYGIVHYAVTDKLF